MGAWGKGYRSSDDFYNEGPDITDGFVKSATEQINAVLVERPWNGHETCRVYAMTTIAAMKAISGPESEINGLGYSSKVLDEFKDSFEKTKAWVLEEYVEDPEWMKVAIEEFDEAEKFFSEFGKVGFLQDRLPSIMEAVVGKID